MNNLKNKIIVILGQTSTGKSDFAVETARNLSEIGITAEIISADSRQVYKGLDLGTGKITKKEMRGVKHHLLDIASPKSTYTVSRYKKDTEKIIARLHKENKIPILCGGTGFYIDAVIDGILLPEVKPDLKLRKELEKLSEDKLFQKLQELDPARARTIDSKNKVRLIRALEIIKTLGNVPMVSTSRTSGKFEVIKIGLTLPDEILKERIKTRLLTRIKKGMLGEIKNLHNPSSPKQGLGLSWKRMEALGLEYRYGAMYLQGKFGKVGSPKAKEEMIEKLNTEIWHYAKRQKTWFKRDKSTIWINPLHLDEKAGAIIQTKKFLG